jgi:hypothetical protein
VMLSQARQLNLSRTVCTTFRWRGTTSRVSVSTAEEYWSAWRSEIGAAGVRPLELGDRY